MGWYAGDEDNPDDVTSGEVDETQKEIDEIFEELPDDEDDDDELPPDEPEATVN